MILKLTYLGEAVLRQRAVEVKEITDEIIALVRDMKETLVENGNGIGLAAPQVKKSLRVFVTWVPKEDANGRMTDEDFKVFINPTILSLSEECDIRDEGCLSIPGIWAPVVRPVKIKVEATDLEGRRFQEKFSGLQARCILHENDHINGVLFIDRVKGKERRMIEPKLKALKKKFKQSRS